MLLGQRGLTYMKLILAIVSNDDSSKVSGNTTFLIGTQDEKVDEVITIIADHSKKRKQMVPSSASYGVGMYTTYPVEVQVGGATIFVLDVERFEKV